MKKKSFGLTAQIITALILGIIVGLVMYKMEPSYIKDTIFIQGIFKVLGDTFIAALKMLLVPVVFFSLIVGVSSLSDIKQLGRIGAKTMAFYVATTAIAISIALAIGLLISPGANTSLPTDIASDVTINEPVPFIDVLINIVPTNPISAMAEGNMLQIIFFSILVGLALTILQDKVPTVKKLAIELNDLFLKMVTLIMLVAPIGVFALTAKTFAALGYDIMLPLTKYIGAIMIALALQVVLYLAILRFLGNVNPLHFVKKILAPMSVGFSTASSAAALPVSMRTAEEKLGVDKKIASFTLPLGATINMDGTAIMQGVATIFIAQFYAINLAPMDYIIVILTATLASIGTAAVPGAGLIMLSLVLSTVGLPIEGIALIIGVDRIIDMTRTAINLCGDAVGTVVIAKSEGALNEEIYNSTEEDDDFDIDANMEGGQA